MDVTDGDFYQSNVFIGDLSVYGNVYTNGITTSNISGQVANFSNVTSTGLTTSRDTTVYGTMDVTDGDFYQSNVFIGDLAIFGNLFASNLYGTLTGNVIGDTTIFGNLYTNNVFASNLYGTLTGNVIGDTTIFGNLYTNNVFANTISTSDITVYGTMDVTDGDFYQSNVFIGDLAIFGNLFASNLYGTLTGNVIGDTTIFGNLYTNNVFASNLYGTLSGNIMGDSNLFGNLYTNNVFASNLYGTLSGNIMGDSNLFGNLYTNNVFASNLYGTLTGNIVGDSNLFGNLYTHNVFASNLYGTLSGNIVGNSNLFGNLYTNNVFASNLYGTLSGNIVGDTFLSGNLTVSGNLFVGLSTYQPVGWIFRGTNTGTTTISSNLIFSSTSNNYNGVLMLSGSNVLSILNTGYYTINVMYTVGINNNGNYLIRLLTNNPSYPIVGYSQVHTSAGNNTEISDGITVNFIYLQKNDRIYVNIISVTNINSYGVTPISWSGHMITPPTIQFTISPITFRPFTVQTFTIIWSGLTIGDSMILYVYDTNTSSLVVPGGQSFTLSASPQTITISATLTVGHVYYVYIKDNTINYTSQNSSNFTR
jgi:hypothetical protein